MMAYENEGYEDMESLILHDDGNNKKLPKSNSGAIGNDDNKRRNTLSSPVRFAEILTYDDGDALVHSSSPKNSFNSFLEPPSYAEAVFRSFDGHPTKQINDHGAVSTSISSGYLKISVTDPRTEEDLVAGGNTYVTYLITTWTNLPEFNGTEFSLRRRFKDIVTLSDRLSDSYRGYFIPMRPDKSVLGKKVMQKQEFVEQRRMALEKYLRKLAAHPVIRRSEELRVFLQTQGKLPLIKTTNVASKMVDGVVKLPKQLFGESIESAKGGADLLRIFKELRQSVTYGWGATKPPIVEEDKEFMEKKTKLQEFELALGNASMQAESLVKSQQDVGETMGKLGLAFAKLTQFETEQAMCNSQKARARDMKNVSTSAVKASRLYRELNSQSIKHLDKLHDYLGVMLDVNAAYSDRSNALLTVQTLVSDVSTLNSRIEKLEAVAFKVFGGENSRVHKIEELKETMKATNEAKNHAIREYERIKENNKMELERLDKERREDFIGMMKGFVVNQVGYAEKMASAWKIVANETSGYANSVR